MSGGFDFGAGNLQKLFAVPKYLLAALLAVFVPRSAAQWVFGSGIGVGEGALAFAQHLQAEDPAARISWIIADDAEAEIASGLGFRPVRRRGWAGFWATLRARTLIVTHGLGDVNRFGVFGATVIHLGHGAPLKLLHLDSPVTTRVNAPGPLRALLDRMYRAGARRVTLYVAGSIAAAERLRTAYRVDPGRVMVLGDPRDDALARERGASEAAKSSRRKTRAMLRDLAEMPAEILAEKLILYAPTWRDGESDPAVPSEAEAEAIHSLLERIGARLVIRSHPLGAGAYETVLGDRVHALGSDRVRDITPVLSAFDAVITDYSSIAIDFALLGEPIVWFAPDLERYSETRGLYEPLEITAAGKVQRSWAEVLQRLGSVLTPGDPARTAALADTRALAERFHAHPEGGAAARVLAEIRRLARPARERVPEGAVFFESFYGRQVACNPQAIDREIARRFPGTPRFWSVTSERIAVPEGATPLLVGGADWHAVRRYAGLLVVNDWLRYGFRSRRGQTVLQTWHGTMLKHLALGRPDTSLRTRVAIRRESRRWSLLLSQNPHSTAQFARSYAYRGEILELGYPRDDQLARAVVPGSTGPERISHLVRAARRELGVAEGKRVLVYAPTWRDGAGVRGTASGVVDILDVHRLAAELGSDWAIVARGHTRTLDFGGYAESAPENHSEAKAQVIDASRHPNVNDTILAADLFITDYSSLMFDVPVAYVPVAFYVPDLAEYRDRERGFTFDFEAAAPGPLLRTRAEVHELMRHLAAGTAQLTQTPEYAAWRERFAPHDDGLAAERTVDALVARGALARANSDGCEPSRVN